MQEIGIGIALYQLQQAKRQRVDQLAMTAEALLVTQPIEAKVNALAACHLSQSLFVQFSNQPRSTTAEGSLLDVIQSNPEQNRFQYTNLVNAVAFSSDGKMIVSGSADHLYSYGILKLASRLGNCYRGTQIWSGLLPSVPMVRRLLVAVGTGCVARVF
jgi:WD40 repeat protein